MRTYIIGNDGITLCREPPATVDKGEIVVATNEELHAAPARSKRLLALWNALPGVEKQTKIGDRAALIDQLWTAIEALPEPQSDATRPSKQEEVIAMLQRSVLHGRLFRCSIICVGARCDPASLGSPGSRHRKVTK
jgi:hypothetical protein